MPEQTPDATLVRTEELRALIAKAQEVLEPAGPTVVHSRYKKIPQGWDIANNDQGFPATCTQNAVTILTNDPAWQGVLGWDEFQAAIVFKKAPPFYEEDAASTPTQPGDVLMDEDYTRIALWLSRTYRLKFSSKLIAEAVSVVARRTTYHPVREYLKGLKWDGTPRIHSWLATYLGAIPEAGTSRAERERLARYLSRAGLWWLLSAVARVFQPGCKADAVLILEGPQGKGKSTALKILAGAWFSDTPFDLGSKDGFLALRGRWIVELAELDALTRSEANRAKAFFSSPVDVYRPPYGREAREYPRQCVFAGTTNQAAYLLDETGGRRFWPVRVGRIDFDALRRDRDQLWAEAVASYKAGAIWHPSDEDEIDIFREQQDDRHQLDPWHERIAEWVVGRAHVEIPQILSGPLELEIGHWGQREQNRVVKVLRFLGWRKARLNLSGKKTWVYVPEKPTAGSPASAPESEF
jgi:putative DNA primase/helicase